VRRASVSPAAPLGPIGVSCALPWQLLSRMVLRRPLESALHTALSVLAARCSPVPRILWQGQVGQRWCVVIQAWLPGEPATGWSSRARSAVWSTGAMPVVAAARSI
jgi:hypothetical protein